MTVVIYHLCGYRYWPSDYYGVNRHFGTDTDLKGMIKKYEDSGEQPAIEAYIFKLDKGLASLRHAAAKLTSSDLLSFPLWQAFV